MKTSPILPTNMDSCVEPHLCNQLLATSHKLHFVRTCQKRRENKGERTKGGKRKKEEEAKGDEIERRGGKEIGKEVRWNASGRPKDSHRASQRLSCGAFAAQQKPFFCT